MARHFSTPLILVIGAVAAMCVIGGADAGAAEHGHLVGWMYGGEKEMEMEFQMDTEINRRMLATSKYISYGALQKNSVPCSRRGASYYNCQAGAQSNPYSRGCSSISRCRS